jgi:hypothetical protein
VRKAQGHGACRASTSLLKQLASQVNRCIFIYMVKFCRSTRRLET